MTTSWKLRERVDFRILRPVVGMKLYMYHIVEQRDEVAADFIIPCPFVGMNLFERFMYRILAAEVGSLG